MHCPTCGKEMAEGATGCPSCGAPPRRPDDLLARPPLVTLLAVLNFFAGGINLLLAALWIWTGLAREPQLVFLGFVGVILGGLHLACGYGLWRLRRFGRLLQLVLAWIGLLVFPLGTVIAIVLLLYLHKPHVKLLFAEKRVEHLSADEVAVLSSASDTALALAAGVAVVLFLGCGLISAIAIPNLLNAIDRGKQKRTMADIRSIGAAFDAFAEDHGTFPRVRSADELRVIVQPHYIVAMPDRDAWKHPLEVRSDAQGYLIRSAGKDGLFESDPPGGPTRLFASDIIFSNGDFVQWPDGTRP